MIIGIAGVATGVWMFDKTNAAMSKGYDGGYPATGAAWIGVVDPRDPSPQRSAMTGAAEWDRIDRRDEAGGATTWFYEPGYALHWVAYAGDQALLVDATRQDS